MRGGGKVSARAALRYGYQYWRLPMRLIVAVLTCLLSIVPGFAQTVAPDPASRIIAYDDSVIAVMKSKGGLAGRADRFEPIVREYYDMPAIAAIVVGPKWAATSSDDRAAAITALARHSALTLARSFGTFDGEKFNVDPQVISRGNSRIVKVTIISPGKRDLLFYQLHETPGGWKILDVISGGVSQLAAQRADVAAAVAAGGAAGLAQRFAKLDKAAR
jgi:phospholipid transport system substrate-binding protein